MDIKNVIERLKRRELDPWFIQANINNFSLLQDEVVDRKEQYALKEVIDNGKYVDLVKEIWEDKYEESKKVEIPEKVLEAFKAGLEEYSCDNLCSDYIFGVGDFWYDEVINQFMEDVGCNEAIFALYTKFYLK